MILVIMNACLARPEKAGRVAWRDGGLLPPTVVRAHFVWRFVKPSIAPVATGWDDGGQGLEIEFDAIP
jgi:hypothetical protein